MGLRAGATGWKLFIGLAVVCGVLVFAGGFLHRHAVDAAVEEQQTKLATYARTKLADDVGKTDLSKPLKDDDVKALARAIEAPPGAEVRIANTDGAVVYGAGGFEPDAEAVSTAAAGTVNHVIDRSDLNVYAPIPDKGGKPLGVAVLTASYADLRADASAPLDAFRVPLVGLGVVFLVAGLALMVQQRRASGAPVKEAKPAKPSKTAKATPSRTGRVSGFGVAPAAEQPAHEEPSDVKDGEPAPASGKATMAKKALFAKRTKASDTPSEPSALPPDAALDREVKIRQALEDQLEQLRTRIQTQDEETARATRELSEQLAVMTARAEEAEARSGGAATAGEPTVPEPAPGAPSAADLADRIRALEAELSQATARSAQASARADALQRERDAAVFTPDPAEESKVEVLTAQLADAQEKATAAEQRAASVESVRDELEVRVAQLGAKATDLERKATELESRLHDATTGGDAVRAEIATLTAALAAADRRVRELEAEQRDRARVGMDERRVAESAVPTPAEPPVVNAAVPEPEPRAGSRPRDDLQHSEPVEQHDYVERHEDVEQHERESRHDDVVDREDVSALYAAAFAGNGSPDREKDDAVVPPAPSDAARYDDVWSAPSPSDARPAEVPVSVGSSEPRSSDDSVQAAAGTAAPSAEADEPARQAPTVASDPFDADASNPDEPEADAPNPDEPDADEGMTPEDDLWALRARLARAGEEMDGPSAPPTWD